MLFFTSLSDIPADFGPSAVTIGKFDGLHTGHRSVLRAVRDAAADAAGLTSTVLTFDRNPLSVLAPERCPDPLVSNEQKRELLADAGIDATVMLRFDRAFSTQSPQQFVQNILVDTLHARHRVRRRRFQVRRARRRKRGRLCSSLGRRWASG